SYLPRKILTNQDLEQLVETNDQWIIERTGIRQRHLAAENETTSDMAYQAAIKALENAKLAPEQIDLIIVATSTPDAIFPSTACILQHKLGIAANKGSFDLQAACSGFIYALTTADCFVRSGMANNVLVVGVDTMSRIVDYSDRATCILFGDGAGAVVIQASEQKGILGSEICADGNYNSILTCEGHLYNGAIQGNPFVSMDGQAVFKFAVRSLTALSKKLIKQLDLDLSKINWVVPHQANIRIIEAVAQLLGISMEKVITTVAEQGNTSAASVPLALDMGVSQGKIKSGDIILLLGVGAGFSWGASVVRM
ncbi:MAG: 3-oxoacyl-ACP synthase, partial [Pseudomonadota bacterium]